jgi:type IV pilus assembly protein PilQ
MRKEKIILFVAIMLMPLTCFGQLITKPVPKVSFDFVDADVRNVLRILTDISGKNLVISDDVKGKVTMKLDNISWIEAMDVVVRSSELVMLEEESIIRIITGKRFEDEKLRDSKRRDELNREKLERLKLGLDLVSKEIKLRYASADEVKRWISGETGALAFVGMTAGAPLNRPAPAGASIASGPAPATQAPRGLLSEYGVVTVVPWNNRVITVKDIRENVEEIERRLKDLDVAPQQVQIEARFVEARTEFSRELGIQWSARFKATVSNTRSPVVSDKDVAVAPSVNVPTAVTPTGTVGVLIGSVTDSNFLDATLSAQEHQGTATVIASPKVITSNYKEAKINSGREVPYQTAGQYGTNVEFKKAELELKVTPQVIGDEIKLEISAKNDEPDTGFPAPYPIITREITTKEVIIKDGETVVIGGIYNRNKTGSEDGVPFLRNIPVIGWLFKRQSKVDNKTELLIFITPRILKNLYREEG